MTKARDLANAADVLDDVSATELSYVNGVTSAIQTQLDAKVAKSLVDAKGDLLVGSANDTVSRLAVASTAGYVLQVDSAETTGLKWAAASSPAFVGVSVEHSDFQNISNNTWTAVQFDQEVFDTDGFHSTSSNNTRLTVPSGKAGYYRISGFGVFTRNATGSRNMAIRKNGTEERLFPEVAGSSSYYVGNVGTVTLYLAVGDYIEFFVAQSSGGTLEYRANLGGGYTSAAHEMIYLGA